MCTSIASAAQQQRQLMTARLREAAEAAPVQLVTKFLKDIGFINRI
jgi:hypothetical protein